MGDAVLKYAKVSRKDGPGQASRFQGLGCHSAFVRPKIESTLGIPTHHVLTKVL